MKKNIFYDDFTKRELKSLPANYRLLTYLEFKSEIITSDTETKGKGIQVEVYNGKIISSEKYFSPISKIIKLG